MGNFEHLKPIHRSEFRVFLGKNYYTIRRRIEWIFGNKTYVKKSNEIEKETILEEEVFVHKTPLYRKLKDVDMWLQENKVENLKIAMKNINGVVIKPGETFSYWKCIGRPTARKGYKKGMVLYYGNYKSSTGGGLCQLSNMIYWMTLHSPLTVTERHRHSFDVFPDSNRTQPFGSGATCVYNYRDLQITNETNELYQINLSMDDEYLIGEIKSDRKPYFSYDIYEKKHEISHEYWGGYIRHNQINKRILDIDNNQIDEASVCENHALMMYEPLLENKST